MDQTQDHYRQAIRFVSLTGLYREQNRLDTEIIHLERRRDPRWNGQIKLREERIAMIDEEIVRREGEMRKAA